MKKLVVLASALAALAFNANAGIFDGKSVKFQYYLPDLSYPYSGASNGTFAVGEGVEILNLVDNFGTLDIQSNGFTAHFYGAIDIYGTDFDHSYIFNGFRITDVYGVIDAFSSFSIIGNTDLVGTPMLTFDADNLWVNWGNTSMPRAGDVQFAVNVAAPVPEPETYAMMLAGLGLLGIVARRRKQKAATA